MTDIYKNILGIAKKLQDEADEQLLPPPEVTPTQKHILLPQNLFKETRGYLENISFQINMAYESTCYDACAVMIRRLIETLIIESFEHYNIADKIKNSNGDFLQLDDQITRTLSESAWNLTRNTKKGLKQLKKIGDLSAHCRRFNARRSDIDSAHPQMANLPDIGVARKI